MLFNQNAISSGDYIIRNSVRLRSLASANFQRTFGTATTRNTWTFSAWVKRASFSSTLLMPFFAQIQNSTNNAQIYFDNDTLKFRSESGGSVTSAASSSMRFIDTTAWYHIIVALDTSQAVQADRLKLYVNGVQQTFSQGTALSLNENTDFNINSTHSIGYDVQSGDYFDGYLAEVYFIDGQALTPSSFGSYSPLTGVWQPKVYSGTYGNNGFYLNFSDTTSTTTLGYDKSGKANHWTATNVSLTSGITYDAMIDSPTPWFSSIRAVGNYCTLDPLNKLSENVTFKDGNLAYSSTSTGASVIGTFGMKTGKWYWEAIADNSTTQTRASVYGTAAAAYYAFASNNNTYGFRFDADAGTLDYTTDGSSWTSLATGLTSGPYFPFFNNNGTGSKTVSINFGQRPYTYTPPTGYQSLSTANLPSPSILKPNQYFDVSLYTGTGAARSVTNSYGFSPDFVWIKSRSDALNHSVYDTVRGATIELSVNTNSIESTQLEGLSSFNSGGFNVGSLDRVNKLNSTYAAWQWDAGSSTVTNTDGTITAQVRANPTNGFSIATYTGTGANGTVGHGLGKAPSVIIVKERGTADDWWMYHQSIGNTNRIKLNDLALQVTSTNSWNSTSPTSSVFTIGTSTNINALSATYVAYCFAEIDGFSKFGSYLGNGSNEGPVVYLGFRPKFVIIKVASGGDVNDWFILDSLRSPINSVQSRLETNTTAVEANLTGSYADFLSNGFRITGGSGVTPVGSPLNQSGATQIYLAFAENPFKYALAR